MTNTRFDGTIEFQETERQLSKNAPFGIDRFFLTIQFKGILKFDIFGVKGEVPIDSTEVFESHTTKRNLQRLVVKKYKEGAVDRMIKSVIISAIKNFKHNKECDIAEVEYNELISGINKYSIELNLKPKDFENRY